MSNYTNTFGGAAKDASNDIILGADHDTELDAVATASATKANKVTSGTEDNVHIQSSTGDLKESGVAFANVPRLDGTQNFTATNTFSGGVVLNAGEISLADMNTNSVDSDQYVDGSIDLIHMSANSVDSNQYVDGSIDLAHMSANSVDSSQYVDGSIDNAHIANGAVDTEHFATDCVGTVEISGALATNGADGAPGIHLVTVNQYAFWPNAYGESGDITLSGHTTDGTSGNSPRVGMENTHGSANRLWAFDYRYMTAA